MTQLHEKVRNDPRYLAIRERREALVLAEKAHSAACRREDAEYAAAREEYLKRRARAMGTEEFADLVEPMAPSVRLRADVTYRHQNEHSAIDRAEQEVFADMADEELLSTFTGRTIENRAAVREALDSIIDTIAPLVTEENEMRYTRYLLMRAKARRDTPRERFDASSPNVLTLREVVAEMIADLTPHETAAPKQRDLTPSWARRRLAREQKAAEEATSDAV